MTLKGRDRTFDLHLLGVSVVLREIRIARHGSRRVKPEGRMSNSREMLQAKDAFAERDVISGKVETRRIEQMSWAITLKIYGVSCNE